QYLNWIQNSAFEGEVNESTLEKIKIGIKKLIKEKDSIIIFKVASQKWIEKEIIGEEKVKITRII
ncbi:MAG: CRISPR-associated endonuclease Cas2, partial [Candidatus Pacearchaeota archaeon]